MKLVKEKVMSRNIPIFVPPHPDKEPLWEIRRTENIAFTTGVKPPHLWKPSERANMAFAAKNLATKAFVMKFVELVSGDCEI